MNLFDCDTGARESIRHLCNQFGAVIGLLLEKGVFTQKEFDEWVKLPMNRSQP